MKLTPFAKLAIETDPEIRRRLIYVMGKSAAEVQRMTNNDHPDMISFPVVQVLKSATGMTSTALLTDEPPRLTHTIMR